jgi:hypothetical protein
VPLNPLIATPEDYQKAKQENFEHAILTRLLRDLSAPAVIVRPWERAVKLLELSQFYNNFPAFPFDIRATRISSYSLADLFLRPTKSPVFLEFAKEFPLWKNRERFLLFFRASGMGAGFTTFVMGNAPFLLETEVHVRFKVRDTTLVVTTYEEATEEMKKIEGLF